MGYFPSFLIKEMAAAAKKYGYDQEESYQAEVQFMMENPGQ